MADLSRTPVTLIGASRGLGRVLAETFHRLGAQVLIVARGQSSLDAVARLMPQTDFGAAGVKGYAAYNGTSEAAFLAAMGPGQTPQQVADALLELVWEAPPGGNFIVSPDGVAALG